MVKGKEILCPASEEAGRRTTCDKCKLCSGMTINAKSILHLHMVQKEVGSMKKKLTITRVNPVAKAMLMLRKPMQTVKPKKGKGSYDRQKDKRNALRSEEL